jgi:hypothetical protein
MNNAMSDARGSLRLNGKQHNQDRDRHRHNIGAERGRRNGQPFERREHTDRRRDGAVPVDESRAEQADKADRAARVEAELVVDRWNRRLANGRTCCGRPRSGRRCSLKPLGSMCSAPDAGRAVRSICA